MDNETPEQKQIRRWLEGVKRYAGRKGYDISVKARELGNLTAAAPAALGENKVAAIEKIGEAAFVDELEKISGKNIIGRFIDRVHHGSDSVYAAPHNLPKGLVKNLSYIEDVIRRGPEIIARDKAALNLFKKSK